MKLSLEQEAAVRGWQALSEVQRERIYDSLRFVHVLHHYEKIAALDVLYKLAIVPGRCERCKGDGYVRFSCGPGCPAGECSVGPCPDCKGDK